MGQDAKNLGLEFEDQKQPVNSAALDLLSSEELDDYHLYVRQSLHSRSEEEESNWLISYADMMTLLVGFFVMLQSFSKVDSSSFEKVKKEATRVFGGEYTLPFEDLANRLKQVIDKQKVNDQVIINSTDDGLELTFRGALFFESGNIELLPQAEQLLLGLIPEIAKEMRDKVIVIEGHTDNRPTVGNLVKSNWELSSLRACTVLHLFEKAGFLPDRLRAQGWGQFKPIVPNQDSQGRDIPENQSQNRRVVIKVIRALELASSAVQSPKK